MGKNSSKSYEVLNKEHLLNFNSLNEQELIYIFDDHKDDDAEKINKLLKISLLKKYYTLLDTILKYYGKKKNYNIVFGESSICCEMIGADPKLTEIFLNYYNQIDMLSKEQIKIYNRLLHIKNN
jgi:hypothetical protein